MEKFSRWSDLATGINPFVPAPRRYHRNFIVRVGQCAFSALLCTIRLPFIVVCIALLLIHAIVSFPLQYIPLLNRLLQRILDYLICSLLLLIFGVLINEEPANLRRLGLIPATMTKGNSSTLSNLIQTKPKDLILCNHTNFFEILYLAKRYSPHFVFPLYETKKESQKEAIVKECNLIQAIYEALRIPSIHRSNHSKPQTLTQILQKASYPIVVFPEGIRSNGQSVLSFLPIQQPTRVHLVAFRYDYHYVSPSFSAGSAWRHLVKISFAVYHQLHLTCLDASHLSQHVKAKEDQADGSLQQYRKLLAAMLRTKGVDLNVEDFCSFNAYWNHVSCGGKASAATFTSRKAPHEHARWNES